MDFTLGDEQRMLQESALRFFAQRHPIAMARRALPWSDESQHALWQDMADMGWLGLLVSEELGGSNLGMGEAFLVAEAAGRQLVNLPLASSLVLLPLLQRVAVRPSGNLQAWLSEVQAGRAAINVTCEGALYMQHYRQCSHQLLLRGLGTDQQPALALWPAPDSSVQPEAAPSGLDPTLHLLRIVKDWEPKQGSALAWDALGISPEDGAWVSACFRLVRIAELLGAASATLDAACEHARTRVQFGRPIGSNQAIKHPLANGWMALDSARLAALYAAASLDARREDWPFACAVAEFTAIQGGLELGHLAIQVHGGLGFSWEHDAHLYLKRIQHIVSLLGGADVALGAIERLQADDNGPSGRAGSN